METLRDITAGIVGGSAGIAVGHPLDTIRIRQQMRDSSKADIGTYSHLRKFIRKEGVLSLFKGFWPPVLGNAPLCAVSFGAVGWANRFQDRWLPRHGNTEASQVVYVGNFQPPLLTRQVNSGIFSGVVTAFVATPIELVKCKMQMQKTTIKDGSASLPKGAYKNSWDCARRVVAAQGVRGLYNGLLVTIVRDIPSWGGYFLVYEYCKWWLRTERPAKQSRSQASSNGNRTSDDADVREAHVSKLSTMLAGGAAGIFAWGAAYPLDVIKTGIQTMPDTSTARERSVMTVSKRLYADAGISAFYRGISPTLLRAVPANAVTFLVYEAWIKGANQMLGL